MKVINYVGFEEKVVADFLDGKGFKKIHVPGSLPVYGREDGAKVEVTSTPWARAGYAMSSAPVQSLVISDKVEPEVAEGLARVIQERSRRVSA